MSIADAAEREAVQQILAKRQAGRRLNAVELARLARFESRTRREQFARLAREVRQQELQELLGGVSRQSISKWHQEGLPAATRSGSERLYDLYVVIPWLRERWTRPEYAGHGKLTKTQAEVDLLVERRVALQLRVGILSGKYLDKTAVEAENVRKIAMIRAGMEALNRSLTPALCELPWPDVEQEQVAELIADHVRDLLSVFAGTAPPRPAAWNPRRKRNGTTKSKIKAPARRSRAEANKPRRPH